MAVSKCTFQVEPMWYLYTITNLVNGKQYIGITINVGRRWVEHKSGRGSKLVHHATKKYGLENLQFDIVCEGCEDDIKQLEIDLIAQRNTESPGGYNLTAGGEGIKGYKYPAGKYNGMFGKKHTAEAKGKMSKAQKGSRNGMFGKKHTAEARGKMSAAHKDYKFSVETREKMSQAQIGQTRSKKTREKISKAHKGREISAGTKEKLSKASKGRKKRRKILVNGTKYTSIKDAAKIEGINYGTLKSRFRKYRLSGNWPVGWKDLE